MAYNHPLKFSGVQWYVRKSLRRVFGSVSQVHISSVHCLLVEMACSPNDPFSAETFVVFIMLPELKKLRFYDLEEKEWCALLTRLMSAYWGLSGAPCALLVFV